MASTASLEGVKKTVFFPFKGEKWGIKMLIGSALGLAGYMIPVVPAIPLLGYFGRMMKRVINDDEDPQLPEWNDWGGLFIDGIKFFGVSVIYSLPALLMVIAGYLLMFVPYFAMMMSVTATSYYTTPDLDPTLFAGSMLGMFGGMALIMVGFFLMLVTAIVLPPALGNMVAKNEFGAAFRIKEWWPVFKANLGGYFIAIAILLGLYWLLVLVIYFLYFTVVLCILLPFAMAAIGYLLSAMVFSLYAVAYRDGVRKLAEAA